MVALLLQLNLPRVAQSVVTLRQAGDLAAYLPDHISCRALEKKGRSRSAFISLARLSRGCRTLIHARNTCCWADATLATMLNPNVKLVLGFHGLDTQGALPRRHRWISRMANYLGARFVSVSQAGSDLLQREAGIPNERIDVIHTGIDRKKFSMASQGQRNKAKMQLGLTTDSLTIGSVGSLAPIKNHELLLRAFAKLLKTQGQKTELVLMGDGPCREPLVALAKHLGIDTHVTWLGQCQDVASNLAALDVYVCSSHSEGISNAMLEAMASGLPVVTTDVGDHGLILRDGIDGIVLKKAGVYAMATGLANLAASRALRKTMGYSARERTAGYDVNRMVANYETFYSRCLFPGGVTIVTKSSSALSHSASPYPISQAANGEAYAGTSGNDEQSYL